MKEFLSLLSASIFMTACGQNAPLQSNPANLQERVATETFFVDELIVTPINGGINPSFAAYKVEGRIMLGANRCEAQGVDAEIDQVKLGEEIHLIAKTIRSETSESRICTREFMPVYKNVAISLLGESLNLEKVIAKNVRMMGQDKVLSEYLTSESEAVVQDWDVLVESAADKSGADIYTISGMVMLGSNACRAGDAKAEFRVETIGETAVVTPIITASSSNSLRMCITLYNPVFATIKTSVVVKPGGISKIEVNNVDSEGNQEVIVIN